MTRAEAFTVLQTVGRRQVRRLAAAGDTREAAALFDIASGGKSEWTLAEWHAILASLDTCELTVTDWLLLQ